MGEISQGNPKVKENDYFHMSSTDSKINEPACNVFSDVSHLTSLDCLHPDYNTVMYS